MNNKTPPQKLFEKAGNEVAMDTDGNVLVTSSGGVEMVMNDDGTVSVAGINGFGIDDLIDIERIDTSVEGERTTFSITMRGGGTAVVVYVSGQFGGYTSQGVGMSIPNKSTKAMISRRKE